MSVAFGLSTLERWMTRSKPHELAWTVSLAMFALASFAYFTAAAMGWSDPVFRAFYLFGAILNVPWLALGTVYLLAGVRSGDRARWWLTVASAFCAGVVVTAPISGSLDGTGIPSGKEVFGAGPRIMAAVGSGLGATVLIAGALWSAVRLVRLRRRPEVAAGMPIPPGRLALTNLLIAIGSVVLGTGGTLFGTGEQMVDFGIWLAAGITILFAGFLVSNPGSTAAAATSGSRRPSSPYWDEIYEIATAGRTPTGSADVAPGRLSPGGGG